MMMIYAVGSYLAENKLRLQFKEKSVNGAEKKVFINFRKVRKEKNVIYC